MGGLSYMIRRLQKVGVLKNIIMTKLVFVNFWQKKIVKKLLFLMVKIRLLYLIQIYFIKQILLSSSQVMKIVV